LPLYFYKLYLTIGKKNRSNTLSSVANNRKSV
jgi:hypothetical protein